MALATNGQLPDSASLFPLDQSEHVRAAEKLRSPIGVNAKFADKFRTFRTGLPDSLLLAGGRSLDSAYELNNGPNNDNDCY